MPSQAKPAEEGEEEEKEGEEKEIAKTSLSLCQFVQEQITQTSRYHQHLK